MYAFYVSDEQLQQEVDFEQTYNEETAKFADANGSMNTEIDRNYQKLIKEKESHIRKIEKITRRNGRLLYKLIGVIMMQFIIAMFTMDYYYWQKVPVPDYYGCAIVILMCLMASHMLMQNRIRDSLKLMNFVVEHPYNFRSQWIPLLVCLLKFKVELLIEVVTLWMCIV